MNATADWHEKTSGEIVEAFRGKGLSEVVRLLDASFEGSLFTLSDLFVEARRRVLGLIIEERLARLDGVYRQLYEESRPLTTFMRESDVPIPPAILMAAEYTLLKELEDVLVRSTREPLPDGVFDLARELEEMDLTARAGEYELLLRQAAEVRAEALKADPLGPDLEQLHRLLDFAGALGLTLNLWSVQNSYHDAARRHRDLLAGTDPAEAAEFWRLGERLYFNLQNLRAPAAAMEAASSKPPA